VSRNVLVADSPRPRLRAIRDLAPSRALAYALRRVPALLIAAPVPALVKLGLTSTSAGTRSGLRTQSHFRSCEPGGSRTDRARSCIVAQ
jgi:hypothetical protein